MKKIETLVIRGRRWFQKLYGNTYHTVTVVVNGHVLKSKLADLVNLGRWCRRCGSSR